MSATLIDGKLKMYMSFPASVSEWKRVFYVWEWALTHQWPPGMSGNAVSKTIKAELKEQVAAMEVKPGLAVLLIGARKDSQTYVKMKQKACT